MAKNTTTKTQAIENSARPNKFLQPFQYQQWKIIGNIMHNDESDSLLKRRSSFTEFVYRFSKNAGGIIGFFILVFFIIAAIVIPFTTLDPKFTDVNNKFQQMFTGNHIFGTDEIGRDMWAMLWYGARFSLALAAMTTLINVFVGVSLGMLMGYFDRFDTFMQWVIKVLTNVPVIIIMILATLVFQPSFWILVMSLAITGWTGMSQQIRAQVKRARNFQWVTASRVLGTPAYKIVWNFLPVTIPILITQLVFAIPGAIIAETSLAFIGLSIPNEPTLGNLISNGANIVALYPRYVIIPSFVLVAITTSIQLIGNSTQDALRRQR